MSKDIALFSYQIKGRKSRLSQILKNSQEIKTHKHSLIFETLTNLTSKRNSAPICRFLGTKGCKNFPKQPFRIVKTASKKSESLFGCAISAFTKQISIFAKINIAKNRSKLPFAGIYFRAVGGYCPISNHTMRSIKICVNKLHDFFLTNLSDVKKKLRKQPSLLRNRHQYFIVLLNLRKIYANIFFVE